jgi:hypothetical protein
MSLSRRKFCFCLGLTVEQKIQLAMSQGDFDNLKGKGKPLERLEEGERAPALREGDAKYVCVHCKISFVPTMHCEKRGGKG